MKKPTEEDLERIKVELQEMMEYYNQTWDERELSAAEKNVYVYLVDAIVGIDEVLYNLGDTRENVINDH